MTKRGDKVLEIKTLFKKDLINLNVESKAVEDFFQYVGEKLEDKGLVSEKFSDAITKREEEYPTGLLLENFSVAIPHTDTNYIIEPFVSINRLKKPITFLQMGTDDVPVEVKDVFVLGIKEPKKQVGLLSKLMEIFMNVDFVVQYQSASTNEEIMALINRYL